MTAREQHIQNDIERLTSAPLAAGDVQAVLSDIRRWADESLPRAAAVAAELLEEMEQADTESGGQILRTGLIRLRKAIQGDASAQPSSNDEEANETPHEEASPGQSAAADLADDPELVSECVAEAREHLASIEANLLDLEKDPEQVDTVNSVFRSFHTIKGLSGFFGLRPIHEVAHETETILDHARERRISMGPRLIDIALKAADYIRIGLDALSSKTPEEAVRLLPPNQDLLQEIAGAAQSQVFAGDVKEPDTTAVRAKNKTPEGEVEQGAEARQAAKKSDSNVVRVDTGKLEYLVEMVGELVIAQSLISFGPNSGGMVTAESGNCVAGTANANAGISRHFAHLARVTGEIQRTALSMRMVPISRLYDKMARLVRDLGRKADKRIEMKRIGDHVELDRNIVEEITDPIVHMIRNSVDHGIEDSATRAASGKSEVAYITLEASHQAGYIILRLSDDGRGLRADKIREKAVQKGLVAADAALDDDHIHKLIFEPGFSTAERVTDISGRGVGMDVVRRQIEKLRGTIEIASKPGEGCSFTLKLPLTLAMVDGLIIEAGGQRYVLPIYSVREMFHVTADKLFTIENRAEMVLLRGALLPVVRLDQFFNSGFDRNCGDATEAQARGRCAADIGIVLEGRTRQFCLIVNRLMGKQEVVIKTLGPCFRNVNGVAGGAILGDGRVGLILDVHGIDGGDGA